MAHLARGIISGVRLHTNYTVKSPTVCHDVLGLPSEDVKPGEAKQTGSRRALSVSPDGVGV